MKYFFFVLIAFLCLAPDLGMASPLLSQTHVTLPATPPPPTSPLNPATVITDLTSNAAQAPSMITQAAALVFVATLPYTMVLLTAYIKIAVVLSILRNALGIQQSPPNQVINGLAIILSLYVMFPTGLQMYKATQVVTSKEPPSELLSGPSAAYLIDIVNHAKEPLRLFLEKNTQSNNLKGFYKLAQKVFPPEARQSVKPTDFVVLVPSYIISQLKDAYEIGVLIYLPFFVIDLVVSNILLAMGMMMLSPLSIALPLKLLLLVMLDGWTVLIQGLVLTFK